MFNKAIIIGLFSFLMLFSFIPTSEAEPWELIIDLNVQKGAIYPGESIEITGRVVDQAYNPVKGVEVLLRAGSDTAIDFTNNFGEFSAEFKKFKQIPGTYTVNVIATWYEKTGLTSTQFQVKGDTSPISILEQKLSTEEAKKYISAQEGDFEKNPIGQTLFKYYQGLHEELILEKKENEKPLAKQIYLEEQRIIAENLRKQAIEFYNPGAGVYDGYQHGLYLDSLNPEIRDLVASQLNFTKNTFEEAQKFRDEILANGGTYEEARQAYLDMISIPKEVLEKFNQGELDELPEESTDENQNTEEDSESQ